MEMFYQAGPDSLVQSAEISLTLFNIYAAIGTDRRFQNFALSFICAQTLVVTNNSGSFCARAGLVRTSTVQCYFIQSTNFLMPRLY